MDQPLLVPKLRLNSVSATLLQDGEGTSPGAEPPILSRWHSSKVAGLSEAANITDGNTLQQREQVIISPISYAEDQGGGLRDRGQGCRSR